MTQPRGARRGPSARALKCAMWNVNGLGDKRGHIKKLLDDHQLYILFLS